MAVAPLAATKAALGAFSQQKLQMALPNGAMAEKQGRMRLLRVELPFCRVWEIHKICSAPIGDALHFAVPLEEALPRLLFQLENSNCFAKSIALKHFI